MDPNTALRLQRPSKDGDNPFYDAEFAKKISQTATDYINAGLAALNYFTPDFDAATDIVDMHQPVEGGPDAFQKLDRNSALNFRHPLGFTEMVTLTTFVAQILFGGEQARSVKPQGPDDEEAAKSINALLAWNDAKLGIYLQGWLWCWAAIVYNRGVWYESPGQDVTTEKEQVEEDDFTKPKVPVINRNGTTRMRNGEPVLEYQKRTRWRTKRTYSGFHNRVDLVSPYDFISDPTLPPTRFQEGRFAGHRVVIPWIELKRRSELDPSHDDYVLPHVVEKIKNQKGQATTPIGASNGGVNTSRTYYERTARMAQAAGVAGAAGLVPGADSVNKDDGGNVECFSLIIRAAPKTVHLYDDEELELIQILTVNNTDVLSVNVRNNNHDEFPYAVGEGRPNAHRQFSPGWALAVKPVQDRVDDLNRTHSQAQKRMGNILVVDNTKCNTANLLSPDKNGLLIERTQEGKGAPKEDLVFQIPVTDTTASYVDEMVGWVKTAENTTGAHAQVQGQTEDPSQTATQFSGVQEMAAGRISSVARLLSEQAITKQTRRFYKNFAQFMPDEQIVEALGKGAEINPDQPVEKFTVIQREMIQGEYTVVPHDGSLPGAEAKEVAAASRAIEAAQNPMFASAFDVTLPGALDPVKILRSILDKSGLNVQEFSVTREQAQQNLMARNLSQGMPTPGMAPPPANVVNMPPTEPVPTVETGAGPITSASQLPPLPGATPPRPNPVTG